ncbi:MAG: 50S ribosomal protein L30 [Bacillati bacterium ANGP1]|uniref:50S ribosomal protein L30 n=1 Tax=Candidatus Segetimicrobium genomatis TaxID=2569760 RepID=A0A537JW49_9BACT|nr:MAG: 50S ribosomal protein L30 [Terrabacteria group bacterium ANGP1]
MAGRVKAKGAPGASAAGRTGPVRRVRVTLRRSLIGRPATQRRIISALGLRRMGSAREHSLSPSVTGALKRVGHLVSIEEVDHAAR